jgi:AraC-like DNA-binding protein
MTWEFTDHLFRFGAICNLFWIVFIAASNRSKLAHTYITIPAMVSIICFLVIGAYDEVALFGWFGYILGFLARLAIVLNWLFTINVLSDSFRVGPFYTVVLAIYLVRALVFQLDIVPHDVMAALSHAMLVGLYIFLIYKVLSQMSGDLLEKRRRFRIWLMLGHILVTVTLMLERKFISGTLYADHTSLIESLGIFLATTYLLYQSIQRKEIHPFEANYRKSAVGMTGNLSPERKSALLAADRHNLELLKRKMEEGLYRKPGLTVAKLAVTLEIQEHRLRKLINFHLGHRNISQYLNNYRVEEAKRRLADISERRVQVLTIAMEAGYVSLRPFNRAFKSRTGLTPTEYREEHLRAQPN